MPLTPTSRLYEKKLERTRKKYESRNAFATERGRKAREESFSSPAPKTFKERVSFNADTKTVDENWAGLKEAFTNPIDTLKGAAKVGLTITNPTMASGMFGPKEMFKTMLGMPSDKGSQQAMMIGSVFGAPEKKAAKDTLTAALQAVDEAKLAQRGYSIVTPSLEDIVRLQFGERSIDVGLPAFSGLVRRAGMPTIIKEGEVLDPSVRGAGTDIAGKVNQTITSGYDRMIDTAREAVRRSTGQGLTTNQIEEMTGISPSQAVLFGRRVGDMGTELSQADDEAARALQAIFQATWPRARSGSRILGLDASDEFARGMFSELTSNRFKNIGSQDDHLRSPTEAGTYIGEELIAPALKRGRTELDAAGSELAQEINKRTQNVGQIVRTPAITNLNIGSFDFPILAKSKYVMSRLGGDLTGLLDEASPTAQSYVTKLENIWNPPGVEPYSLWHNAPETIARQEARLKRRIRGYF